ncbi:MAG: CPBP family intramembrane metalloprotease [Sphaerochaetaceae bacterium]|nr:CPBP family intramembrane metalloprotease [Sphaerochaetaceae bacterium]
MREISRSKILIMILIALFSFVVLGVASYLILSLLLPQESPFSEFLILNTPHLLMFISLAISSKKLLGFSVFKLSTDREKFSTSLFFLSFPVALLSLLLVGAFTLFTQSFTLDLALDSERLCFLLSIILLTPIQCIAEELLFRVLIARLVYKDKLDDNKLKALLVSCLSGILFLLPHITNNETELTEYTSILFIYYFLFGFLSMLLAIYLKGFEASFALHTSINMYTALIVGYKGGSFSTRPIILLDKMENPIVDVILLIIMFTFMFLFVTQARKKGLHI